MTKEPVIVIFGCRHKEEFLARIDAAMFFVLRNNINPIFVFTGSNSPPLKEVIDVKEVIDAIDIFRADRIIWENVSRDTQENIRNTLEIIRCAQLDRIPIYLISSWYHVPRIKLLLRREGANLSKFSFVNSYSSVKLINILVEPFAFLAAYFRFNRCYFIVVIKRILGYNI